jgi:antirestriction protein ArdC
MRNLYQEVTDRIVAELEAGTPPWAQPWSETFGFNIPRNAATGREYNGVNKLLLWLARGKGWPAPHFLTFKQANELGGHVRKGERGSLICFVKDLVFKDSDVGDDDEDERRVRMLKQFVVFNIAQCEGLPDKIANPPAPKPRHRDGRDPIIEEFLSTIGANIQEGTGRCVYIHNKDLIEVPAFEAFDNGATYYVSIFHEVIHWTGPKHRLDRNFEGRFEPKQRYAAEELVAELGSAFLAAEFSIDGHSDHAGYIASWIKLLKSDPKAIFTCASKAQAAVDYLRALVLREPAPGE